MTISYPDTGHITPVSDHAKRQVPHLKVQSATAIDLSHWGSSVKDWIQLPDPQPFLQENHIVINLADWALFIISYPEFIAS